MSAAATSWLEALDGDQRRIAVGAAPGAGGDDAERRRWFYTPTDHGGLTFHQQRPAQQQAAMRLVASGLSTPAYVTVAMIIGLENVLDAHEGFGERFGRERGRDPGLYYLRVFGDPGGPRPWGWRFGGHHVSLNNLILDGRLVSATPLFLGANPATSPLLGGVSNRPLAAGEDLARSLVRSLPDALRQQAVLLDRAPRDLVSGNRSEVRPEDRPHRASDPSDRVDDTTGLDSSDHESVAITATPKGVPATELTGAQRDLLRALLGSYLDRAPAGVSAAGHYAADDRLDAVHFAWAGPTEAGRPHYYRLQAPNLLIEWDNTQTGANHAHSVWRNPGSDFGLDVLARHRAAHHEGRGSSGRG